MSMSNFSKSNISYIFKLKILKVKKKVNIFTGLKRDDRLQQQTEKNTLM
jgi:hypothetical protein